MGQNETDESARKRIIDFDYTLEARGGIEPPIELLQSSALPLGDRAVINGRRKLQGIGSPRKSGYQFAVTLGPETLKPEQRRPVIPSLFAVSRWEVANHLFGSLTPN